MKGFFLIAIILLSIGCSRHRDTAKLKGLRNSKLIDSLEFSQLQYDWFNAKISTEIGNDEEVKSFKTVVKIRKDSAIWMSISPLLGIEISRILITPDSIKFIDKINNKYFVEDFRTVQLERSLNVEYATLEQMLVANSILFDASEKFRSTKGENNYIITSKTKRKVRKAVGFEHKGADAVETADSLGLDIDEKKYKRALEKNEEGDLIIKRYWLSLEFNRIVKSLITFVDTKQVVEAEYNDFEIHDSIYFPEKINYRLTDNDLTMKINLKYNRVRINKQQTFPFTIPDHFTVLEPKL